MARSSAALDRKRRRCGNAVDRALELANPHVLHLTSLDFTLDQLHGAWGDFDRGLRRSMRMPFGHVRVVGKTPGSRAGYHLHAILGGYSKGWRPHYATVYRLAEEAGFGSRSRIEAVDLARTAELRAYLVDHVDDRHTKERPIPLGRRSFVARI